MPLIMLTGGPVSGKSFITKQLVAQCKKLYPDREVQVLSHETMNIPRCVFVDMNTEKKFNQKLISCVEQALTARRVLIVDYICLTKSMRYQFYGKANFTGTVSCVVQCLTPYEIALEQNKSKQIYTDQIFEDLWNRYEEPQDTCRWDYPLHPIDLSNVVKTASIDENINEEQYIDFCTTVLQSVCENSKKALSRSNLPTRNESGAIVTLLDKITTLVIEDIIKQQQNGGFVVGALLEKGSFDVSLDAANYFINNNNTNKANTVTTPEVTNEIKPEDNDTTTTTTVTAPEPKKTSGLTLMRKKVGAKKTTAPATAATAADTTPSVDNTNNNDNNNNDKNTINNKYILTLHQPFTPSQLFEFKAAFTKIATMMNLKTDIAIARGFIEYLMPLV